MTLTEFLQEKAKDETARERWRLREEWVGSVNRLIGQFQVWLREADTPGVLTTWMEEIEIVEERIGAYRVPMLHIRLNGTEVKVIPVASSAVGTIREGEGAGEKRRGRVDAITPGMRFIMYRTVRNDEEIWYAVDEHHHSTLLDKSRFQAIMLELLS